MKIFIIIASFLLAILFLSFVGNDDPVNIRGYIKFQDSTINIRRMLVIVRNHNKTVASAHTDTNGDFYLAFTPQNGKSYKFYCSAPAIGTVFMKSVKGFESDSPEMTFYIPRRKEK